MINRRWFSDIAGKCVIIKCFNSSKVKSSPSHSFNHSAESTLSFKAAKLIQKLDSINLNPTVIPYNFKTISGVVTSVYWSLRCSSWHPVRTTLKLCQPTFWEPTPPKVESSGIYLPTTLSSSKFLVYEPSADGHLVIFSNYFWFLLLFMFDGIFYFWRSFITCSFDVYVAHLLECWILLSSKNNHSN